MNHTSPQTRQRRDAFAAVDRLLDLAPEQRAPELDRLARGQPTGTLNAETGDG